MQLKAMPKPKRGRPRKPHNAPRCSPEEARARFMLFKGRPAGEVGEATGLGTDRAKAILAELVANECGPQSAGPYTVEQSSLAVGLSERGLRRYCQEGRLGELFRGTLYLIGRKQLLKFGARERRAGETGKRQKAEEMKKLAALAR